MSRAHWKWNAFKHFTMRDGHIHRRTNKFVKHCLYRYSLKSYPGLANIIKWNKLSFICSEEKNGWWRMTRMQQRVKVLSLCVFENHSQWHISQHIPKRTWKCYYICCFFSPSFPSRWTTFIKAQLLTWYAVGRGPIFIYFFSTSWHDVTMHEIHETLDTACTTLLPRRRPAPVYFFPSNFQVVLEINARYFIMQKSAKC